MILIATLIVTSIGAIYSFLAWKFESVRKFANMDKYVFSLLISILLYLIDSIIVNLDMSKKLSFILLFIFNLILIASVTFIYENFSSLVESYTGNKLSWNDLTKMTKEIYNKQVKETNTMVFILRNALTISISFLLLNNVKYSNYILISFNFFIVKFLVFKVIDRYQVTALNNFRQQKSITLYNSNDNLYNLTNTLMCSEWKDMIKDDLIQKIVYTVNEKETHSVSLDTNTYLRIITNKQLINMMQFIIESCKIILIKNSDNTIVLTFFVNSVDDLNTLYIQQNKTYKKALEEKTYLVIDDPKIIEEYNYQTDLSQPVVNQVKNILKSEKNKNIILSLLWNNFNDKDSDEYTIFFQNKDNLELFSNYNQLIKPYSINTARIDIDTEEPHKKFYIGTYAIDDNNNKVPHGIGFLYQIDNEEQIGLIGRLYYLYGLVVKLEFINEDVFFPVRSLKNNLLTDEFGHVIIYPITNKCLTDTYEILLKTETKDPSTIENEIQRFQVNLLTYFQQVTTISPTNVPSQMTDDISDNPQDVNLSFWESLYAVLFSDIEQKRKEKVIMMSSKYRCDIKRNNKCGPKKENNLKIKLIQKEYEDSLKQYFAIDLDGILSTDFSFNELFCDFNCTSHAIYLIQYLNFENISNYSILTLYLENSINFECSINNLKWNDLYIELKNKLENHENICLFIDSENDMFTKIRDTLITFFKKSKTDFTEPPSLMINTSNNICIPYASLPYQLNDSESLHDSGDTINIIKDKDLELKISSFDMILRLIFFNFIKASTKLQYTYNTNDQFKQFNTCLTTVTSITLLLIYLQDQKSSNQCNDITDAYQQKIMDLEKITEQVYYDNDYTVYTKEMHNNVKSIKSSISDIIKKVNGNTINDRIYLQNVYLELVSVQQDNNLSNISFSNPNILKTQQYYVIKSIRFVSDNLVYPIMRRSFERRSSGVNIGIVYTYYVNLQLFLNNASNVVDVKTKLCDRIKFYKRNNPNPANPKQNEDPLDELFDVAPFKETPYLVRLDYNQYYICKNCTSKKKKDTIMKIWSECYDKYLECPYKFTKELEAKTTENVKYFNILFSKDTINNISDKLESIKLFSNSLFMYNKVSNKCTGTYRIIDNQKIISDAVSNNLCTLKYAPDNLKKNVDVLYSGMSSNSERNDLSNFWTTYVHGDKFLTKTLLERNGLFLRYDNWALQTDKPTVLIAVRQNGMALQYASDTLKSDREVVLAAVRQNGIALGHASDTLKSDGEVVLAAVRQNGIALGHASDTLKSDQKLVCAAVTQNGLALQYTSDDLKKDKKIVLTAVKKDGLALQFSLVYQQDNEIVKNAVDQNGLALKFAGYSFISKKTNRDWIKNQIIQDGTMFVFLFNDYNWLSDFVKTHLWNEIATENICSTFNLISYNCTSIVEIQKKIYNIFGKGDPIKASENLTRMFEVSMEHFTNDDKNRKYVINWYTIMGLFEKYEKLFRVAVTKDGMLLKELPVSKLLEMTNYTDIVKNAAIQNPEIVFDEYMYENFRTSFQEKTRFETFLYDILKEPTEKNGKNIMMLFYNFRINKEYRTRLAGEFLKFDYKDYERVFNMLTDTAISSNWESLEVIIYYDKFISKTTAWDQFYEAVKKNFAAIQYIKEKALIVDI